MSAIYSFGLSQEDERSEAAALALDSDDRVLAVASAGDMPLSLLALGARHVTGLDIDANQLHLCHLKVAAVATLERKQALEFLGFLPASEEERVGAFVDVARHLPAASRRFWAEQRDAILSGAIWAGRYERYVRRLVRMVRPFVGGKIKGLFACTDLAEQDDYFTRTFDRAWLRFIFTVAFHPRVFARGGMDARSLSQRDREQSVGEQYFAQFRNLCTGNLARENHHLQLHLLGRVVSEDFVPAYLTPAGFATARAALDRLELVHEDLRAHLDSCPVGSYDKVHLSNVPDWLAQPQFDAVMSAVAERLAPGARLVWRSLHTDYPLAPATAARLLVDRELGRELQARDKFPFYDIMPAERR